MSVVALPSRLASRRGWILILLPLLVLALIVAMNRWPLASAPTDPPARVLPSSSDRTDGQTLQADNNATPPTGPQTAPQREPVDRAPAGAGAAADFCAQVEHLAELGEATTALAQADEIEAARASDAEARDTFASLLEQFTDAGERAIDLLTTIPGDSTLPRDGARRAVLQLVLAAECARRESAAEAAADRTRIDALVHALLAAMPQNEPLAELGAAVLDRRPFLRLCHEPRILELVLLAGQQQFPRPAATRLLLTLWDNLQRTGERSSEELASLAMVLLADADPSKRTAACRLLLGDGRYRPVVLAWLRENRDVPIATEVANLAARELPPTEALSVLRELGPVLTNLPNAYMALGYRAPETVADAYRQLLAENTHPETRADLVAGLAMADPTQAVPAVELALTSDPSPAVRLQAMLSLTASAAASHGETACQRALDDPAVMTDPSRLATVVFALQNLEAAGLTNAVDRLGQRLRAAALRTDTRLLLEQLLARALPAGQTSNDRSSNDPSSGTRSGR